MGASVFYAIRDAVREASTKQVMDFNSPATVENIRMACDDTFSLQVSNTDNTIRFYDIVHQYCIILYIMPRIG